MLSASILVFPREPQGEISPFLHGLSLDLSDPEEGVFVGEKSEIPHQNGIRARVLQALKTLEPPVLRAQNAPANWRDGIGTSRPTRVSTRRGLDEIQSGAFGLHEWIELCRDVNARAYLSADVALSAPRELAEQVEYCNFAGGTTLSNQRAENGSPNPFGVEFWGIEGDPSTLSPNFYAAQFRCFESVFPRFSNQNPLLIASGPQGESGAAGAAWTRQLLQNLEKGRAPRLGGLDAHFEVSNNGQFGTATEFSLDEYYGLLSQSLQIGDFIDAQREILDASTLGRAAKLILGRWGVSHAPSEAGAARDTLRDAICAAMTLDLLHGKSSKVAMASLDSTSGGQNLFQTQGDATLLTPTFHVFDLYKRHRGGQLLHADFESGEAGGLPRLSGSASLRGDVVSLSVVNSGAKSPVEATISLPGQNITLVAARELSGEGLAARNSLEAPEAVAPREIAPGFDPSSDKSSFAHTFAPASVTLFTIQLG